MIEPLRPGSPIAATGVPQNHTPRAVFPGSFNPLHEGHLTLARIAAARLQASVHYELSIANVDKPPLTPEDVQYRLNQFAQLAPVWLTRAATFREKAKIFPGTTFILGFDTALRLFQPQYYGSVDERDSALSTIQQLGCRFLIGGRVDESGRFWTWQDLAPTMAEPWSHMFEALNEEEFRVDLSSRGIRSRNLGKRF